MKAKRISIIIKENEEEEDESSQEEEHKKYKPRWMRRSNILQRTNTTESLESNSNNYELISKSIPKTTQLLVNHKTSTIKAKVSVNLF
jgi:hypothetical protein